MYSKEQEASMPRVYYDTLPSAYKDTTLIVVTSELYFNNYRKLDNGEGEDYQKIWEAMVESAYEVQESVFEVDDENEIQEVVNRMYEHNFLLIQDDKFSAYVQSLDPEELSF